METVAEDMFGKTNQDKTLALELTEMGLSLFVCEKDEPIECVAHVDLDDPDFSKKLTEFRKLAEASVGKHFSTEIWLPDEQIMFRSLKLDDEDADDRRFAASSALSASTPFQGKELCFDLGDTNGAGYTPVAAIPKEKMDEAMAFAKKMRLNPKSITTSNVVSGFSERPDFQPYVQTSTSRSAPARVAAMALLVASPFLMFGSLEKEAGSKYPVGNALVVSFENMIAHTTEKLPQMSSAEETAHIGIPSDLSELNSLRAAPQISASVNTPDSHDHVVAGLGDIALPVFAVDTELTAPAESSIATTLPSVEANPYEPIAPDHQFVSISPPAVAEQSDITAQTSVALPSVPTFGVMDLDVGMDEGSPTVSMQPPRWIFEAGPDSLPDLDALVVSNVPNVFQSDPQLDATYLVEEAALEFRPKQDLNPTFVQVADARNTLFSQRPTPRAAPRLIQPSFMPPPKYRPKADAPRVMMNFDDIGVLIRSLIAEDPPPDIKIATVDPEVSVENPSALFVVLDRPTAAIMERAHFIRREQAKEAALASQSGPLATSDSPKARIAVPLAGLNGAFIQIFVPQTRFEDPELELAFLPTKAKESLELGQPALMAKLMTMQPSLPDGVHGNARSGPASKAADRLNADTRLAQRSAILANLAQNPRVPRPPSRRLNGDTAAALDPVIDAIREELFAAVPLTILQDNVSAQKTAPELRQEAPEQVSQTGAPNPNQAGASSEIGTDAPVLSRVASLDLQVNVPGNQRQEPAPDQIATGPIPELVLPRPPKRPEQSTQIAALIEELEPQSEANPVTPPSGPISKYAIGKVLKPISRPADMKQKVAKILQERNSVANVVAKRQVPVKTTPKERLRIPSGARVSATATIKDAIALGDISLIGIYGTSKTRRALVRLPQGRYVQISRGDNVSGWTVSAVGEDAVRIQKGKRNKVLRLPN